MTKLYLHKWGPGGSAIGAQHRTAVVPRCPWADFGQENDTPEVRALLAEGFHISGHSDAKDEH